MLSGNVGTLFTWGKGYFGVLGNGYEVDNFSPSRMLQLKELASQPIRQVSLGVSHTVMLMGKLSHLSPFLLLSPFDSLF